MLPPRKQASLFHPDGINSVEFSNLIMAIWYFSWFFCSFSMSKGNILTFSSLKSVEGKQP